MVSAEVRSLLQHSKLKALYTNTFYSLLDRLDPQGYLEESFVPGRYPGDFARSTGAFVFCMAEAGEVEKAECALRFVLDSMERHNLYRAPHVLGKPGCGQELDMTNQIDGTAHILSAYAELILRYHREDLYQDYWPRMAAILDIHTDAPYFFASEICMFPVAKINLFLNTLFEHSREERYWSCFDLLTQSFMGAAMDKMIAVARMHGRTAEADRWSIRLNWLRDGICRNLLRQTESGPVYAEMRLPNSNDGVLFEGQGWVSLSPIAAGWEALPGDVMHRTAQCLRAELWREDPCDSRLHYLDKDSLPGGTPCLETIGKGIGWDLEEARRSGDDRHIVETLEFLKNEHHEDLYGECMFIRDGTWQTRDNGNAEQCLWWCWAMGRLRADAGLPIKPDREDITIRYASKAAEGIQHSIGG